MICVSGFIFIVLVNFSPIHAQNTAREKCDNFSTLFNALLGDSLIDVRTDTRGEENPHIALLGYGKNDGKSNGLKWEIEWKCGGVLISENYILTAAHCVAPFRELASSPVRFIRLGATRLSIDSLGEISEVETAITHPDYNSSSHYNDIALVKLRRSVKFSKTTFPACLSITHFEKQSSAKLESVGWGPSEYRGSIPDTLWNSQLEYSTHEKCQNAYKNQVSKKLKLGIVDLKQICAYKASDAAPCFILSGFPLQVRERQLPSVVGVTSFGKACESETAPGIYTRVSAYIPWIESVVWK